jgi:hypothetical protein
MYWMGLEHLFDVAHKSGDFDGSPSANRMVFEKAELVGLRTVAGERFWKFANQGADQ